MSQHISIVATFTNRDEAGAAVRDLQDAGFDMHKLSVVRRDFHDAPSRWNGVNLLGGLDALGEAAFSCIPPERVPDYEKALKGDQLLLVAYGSTREIEQANRIISQAHPGNWDGGAGSSIFYGCAS